MGKRTKLNLEQRDVAKGMVVKTKGIGTLPKSVPDEQEVM